MLRARGGEVKPLADVVRTWPPHRDTGSDRAQGLPLRLAITRPTATAELDLGDDGRFWPADEALARLKAIAAGGAAAIVYE